MKSSLIMLFSLIFNHSLFAEGVQDDLVRCSHSLSSLSDSKVIWGLEEITSQDHLPNQRFSHVVVAEGDRPIVFKQTKQGIKGYEAEKSFSSSPLSYSFQDEGDFSSCSRSDVQTSKACQNLPLTFSLWKEREASKMRIEMDPKVARQAKSSKTRQIDQKIQQGILSKALKKQLSLLKERSTIKPFDRTEKQILKKGLSSCENTFSLLNDEEFKTQIHELKNKIEDKNPSSIINKNSEKGSPAGR